MKRVVAAITGLHVLLHGIFGCCGHGLAATADVADPCHCHHVADSDHAEHSPARADTDGQLPPYEQHKCPHSTCHWLATSSATALDWMDFDVALTGMPAIPVAIAASTAAEYSATHFGRQKPALPLRLHLVVGVLLI